MWLRTFYFFLVIIECIALNVSRYIYIQIKIEANVQNRLAISKSFLLIFKGIERELTDTFYVYFRNLPFISRAAIKPFPVKSKNYKYSLITERKTYM